VESRDAHGASAPRRLRQRGSRASPRFLRAWSAYDTDRVEDAYIEGYMTTPGFKCGIVSSRVLILSGFAAKGCAGVRENGWCRYISEIPRFSPQMLVNSDWVPYIYMATTPSVGTTECISYCPTTFALHETQNMPSRPLGNAFVLVQYAWLALFRMSQFAPGEPQLEFDLGLSGFV
jgi:hypothetical protein